jgi:hypothetical protein
MNVAEFMFNAKAGLLNGQPSRRISNKGSIEDIRKRMKEQLLPGGFRTYGMLGSQNAMSTAQTATITPVEPAKPAEPVEPVAPGGGGGGGDQPPSKETMGGSGGKQSEESKEVMEERERESAVEPAERPPYDLSTAAGKQDLKTYIEYVKKRYGKDVGRQRSEELQKDSEGFTIALKAWRQINKEIIAYNKDDNRQWKQWANNTLVDFADDIIEGLGSIASARYPQAEKAIEKIKQVAHKFKPTEKKDFVASMKEIQRLLFEGKPEWKARLDAIANESFKNWMEKMKGFPGMDDGLPPGADRSKVPFGGL